MTCYHPLKLYRSRSGPDLSTGSWACVSTPARGYQDLVVTVPCGQCVGCRSSRATQWAVRCVHEAQLHPANCFITLTYQDNPITLSKRDLQLFVKRLRKAISPHKIRYLACGEYGKRGNRPHYHALIFGWSPPDLVPWRPPLYISDMLSRLWGHGYTTVGAVSYATALYVAKYCVKSERVADFGLVPPFILQSRRPGLGAAWLQRYLGDVYRHDGVHIPGTDIFVRPPRYYDKLLDKLDPYRLRLVREKRRKEVEEVTPDQLARREHNHNVLASRRGELHI